MQNPTKIKAGFGGLGICGLHPADQLLDLEYSWKNPLPDARIYAFYRPWPGKGPFRRSKPGEKNRILIDNLQNHRDYEVHIKAVDAQDRVLARSENRLFACAFVPGTVVAYLNPEDYTFDSSGRSTCSPSIVRAPDGALVASHDIYWNRQGRNLTHVYRSEDEGKTWNFCAELFPCFWGSLFCDGGYLYILGIETENGGSVLLYRSEDSGRSFSGPFEILSGPVECGGWYHKAPMPVTVCSGRLWTAIETGIGRPGYFKTGAISVPLGGDLTDPAIWTATGFLEYDPATVKGISGLPSGNAHSEGNIVVSPDGRLFNILRFQTQGCVPAYGKAYVTELDPENPGAMPKFHSLIDFPGNLTKFFILCDKNGEYYALSNPVTTDRPNQRNILALSKSENLFDWTRHRDILNYADNCFFEDESKVGFQYPSFIFDGDDILALSRTALNGAHNFHDANYITFHRIRNYVK